MAESAQMGRVSEALYGEIRDFYSYEAELLDNGEFTTWFQLLTDDIEYKMPIRLTRERSEKVDYDMAMDHFFESKASLQVRVERLYTEYAWAEDPPSRTRHFVTNIRVLSGKNSDEFEVKSNVLVYRNRNKSTSQELFSYERRDQLRRVEGQLKLAKRFILIDQAVLGAQNLSTFL